MLVEHSFIASTPRDEALVRITELLARLGLSRDPVCLACKARQLGPEADGEGRCFSCGEALAAVFTLDEAATTGRGVRELTVAVEHDRGRVGLAAMLRPGDKPRAGDREVLLNLARGIEAVIAGSATVGAAAQRLQGLTSSLGSRSAWSAHLSKRVVAAVVAGVLALAAVIALILAL